MNASFLFNPELWLCQGEKQEEHADSSEEVKYQMDYGLWIIKMSVAEWCFFKSSWESVLCAVTATAALECEPRAPDLS